MADRGTRRKVLLRVQILEIKKYLRAGYSYRFLADCYDVRITTIKGIANRRRCKLTPKDVREIRVLLKEGNMTHREIGEMYGVTKGVISDIKCGRTWHHVK